MEDRSQAKHPAFAMRRMRIAMVGLLFIALAAGVWVWRTQSAAPVTKATA